jgi:exosome complex component RRP4
MLSMKEATSDFIERGADLTQYYNLGDYIVTKIINVTTQKLLDVSMKGPGLRKLRGGQIMTINYNKVPRVIGKQGSMIAMIKDATKCMIIVGQNGLVWVKGEPENEVIARQAIELIDQNSHVSGLTDRIKSFLEEKKGNIGKESSEKSDEIKKKPMLSEKEKDEPDNDKEASQ